MDAFLEFDAALATDMNKNLQEWKLWCQTWEKDRTTRNPFEVTKISMSTIIYHIFLTLLTHPLSYIGQGSTTSPR